MPYIEAKTCFELGGWTLPPDPRWDLTDFGLGRFNESGLVLVNLAEEPEYCEKLMYSRRKQVTPMHAHRKKKEDIVCRSGSLVIELWQGSPADCPRGKPCQIKRNGLPLSVSSGDRLLLKAGERVTLFPGVYHAFWPESDGCVIGEISTANDDTNDNIFIDPAIGRFPAIEEDEPPVVRLISES